MKLLFTNKKVVAALVGLVLAILSALLGVDLGDGAMDAVTGAVCQIVECT